MPSSRVNSMTFLEVLCLSINFVHLAFFLFFLTGLLYIYCGFHCCISMAFLCVQMCMSCAFVHVSCALSLAFFLLVVWLPHVILVYFIVFYIIILYYFLDVCLYFSEKEKERVKI